MSNASVEPRPRASVKDRVEGILAEYLGRQTAATAVKIAARTWVRVEPEAVTPLQLAPLCHGLEPMLKTLLGAQVASSILERVRREVTR